MARMLAWRSSGNGSVARIKNSLSGKYSSNPMPDMCFFIQEGKRIGDTIYYPKLQIVGTKNDRIDRNNVILSVNVYSIWHAKELLDAILTIAYDLHSLGNDPDHIKDWIMMHIRMVDSGKRSEIRDPW